MARLNGEQIGSKTERLAIDVIAVSSNVHLLGICFHR
jgi:hypothetical protein